jgi:hypothetical protein
MTLKWESKRWCGQEKNSIANTLYLTQAISQNGHFLHTFLATNPLGLSKSGQQQLNVLHPF